MADADPVRRTAGAQAAGAAAHPFFVDPLRAALTDDAPEVRAAAAMALGEIGVPRTSKDLFNLTRALTRATKDSDDDTARAAVLALARYPFPDVRRTLRSIARSTTAPAPIRSVAGEALKRAANHEARRRLTAYLDMTSRESASEKIDARFRIGVSDRPLLIAGHQLLQSDARLHERATSTIAEWADAEEARPFLLWALESTHPKPRVAAAAALVDDLNPTVKARLIGHLTDVDPAVRASVIDSMALRPGDDVAHLLVSRLAVESEAALRTKIARALEVQPEAAVWATVRRWPSSVPASARRLAVDLAETKTSSGSTEILVHLLVEASAPSVAKAATRLLETRSDRALVPPLTAALSESSPRTARRRRLLAIAAPRSDRRITSALLEIVGQGRVDPQTLDAIAGRPEEDVRPPLLSLTSADDPEVRHAALSAIRKYEGDDVAEALGRAALKHPRDNEAFSLLLEQPSARTLDAKLELLASDEHRPRHRTILETMDDDVDARIPDAVVEATRLDPKLAPIALEILDRQTPTGMLLALSALAGDERLETRSRAAAVKRMAAVERPEVQALIRPLANDPELTVRMTARNALHDIEPETYPSWDPYGRVPLVVEGGAFGATMMLLASEIADAKLSPAFTGGVGMLLGGATPFLLTLGEDVTLGDAGYFGTMGVWGTTGGYGLGARLGLDRTNQLWVTVAGEALGVAAGALTMKRVEWGLDEVALANITATETAVISAAIAALVRRNADDRGRGAVEFGLVGGAAGATAMAFLGRRLQVEDDLALIGTSMAHGAWLGAWAPGLFTGDPDGDDVLAGILVGQGVGFIAGLTAAQFVDLDGDAAAYSGLGAATGAAMFGGLALALDSADSRVRVGLLEAGSAAGALTMAIVGPSLQWNENDVILVSLAAAGGAVVGGRFSVRADEGTFDEPGFPGGMLMGAGIGTAVGLGVSQFIDVSDRELGYTLLGGGVLGVAGQGLGHLIGDLDVRTRSNITGAGIATGLALTYPFSDELSLDGADIAYASLAGVLGATFGAFTPVYMTDDADDLDGGRVGAGLVVGLSLGAYAAGLSSHWLELESAEVGLTAISTIAGTSVGAGFGLLVPSASRRTTIALMQGAGALSFGVMSALFATDLIRLRGSVRDPGSTLASNIATLSAHGAWHGGLVPYTWHDDAPPASEVAGGVMLGAGVGAISGLVLTQFLERPFSGGELAEASLMAAAANGLGGGIGLVANDRRLGASLMEGLGLAGYAGALLVAPHTEYGNRSAPTFLAGALTLGWMGAWTPKLLDEQPAGSRHVGGAMAGTSLGVLGSALLIELRDERDDIEMTLATAAGLGLGAGLGLLTDPNTRHDRRTIGLMEAGGVLALGTTLVVSPYTEYSVGDSALGLYATALGGVLGGVAPRTWNEGAVRAAAGGVMFGASTGLATSMILTQFIEPTAADVFELSLLTGAAASIGGGIAVAANLDRTQRARSLGYATAGGAVLAALVAPLTSYDTDPRMVIGSIGLVGALHGAGLPRLWGDLESKQTAGGALIGGGAGILVGTLVSQVASPQPDELFEAFLATFVGDGLGLGLGVLLSDDPRRSVVGVEVAGLSAYALGLTLAPYTNYSDEDLGLLVLGSAIGAWHGGWIPALDSKEASDERVGGGVAFGAAAGMLGAAAAAQFVDLSASAQIEGGATWLTASALGAGLGLLLPDIDDRTTVGLMQGAGIVGLGTGLLLSDTLVYDDGDTVLVPAGAAFGAAVGLTLPALILDPDAAIDGAARGGGVLLGAGVGTAVAAVASQFVEIEADDVAEAGSASLVGAATGLGLGLMIPRTDRRTRFALMDGAGAAGLALGVWLAPETNLDEDALWSMALGGAVGGLAGGLTPVLFNGPKAADVPGEQAGGGVLAGAGLGLATGLLLDQTLELESTTREHAAFGAALAGLAGAGIGLTASDDDRVFAALTQGLTVAGAIGVGATARYVDYDAGDIALGSAYVGYLTWHSLGLTLLLDGSDRQAAGVVMSTAGLGALTGMYLAPYINLSMSDTLMLLAGNVWGTWIGGWGGAVLREQLSTDLSGRRGAGLTLLTSVLGSDVGLAVTSMVVGGVLDVEPTRFAVINLSGLGGMMVGMLAAGFAKDEPLRTGNVVGSLSGLVLGAVVTSFFDWEASPTWEKILGEDETPAAAVDTPGGDSKLGIDSWFPSARVEPTDTGEERYLFTIGGTWH